MRSLTTNSISDKKVLLRTDYNVSLTPSHTIADDKRITETLPTIKNLLKANNKVIILSHLDRPTKPDPTLSLKPVRDKLTSYLPDYDVILVPTIEELEKRAQTQTLREILLLENIRFYKEEQANDKNFAKRLADLGDVYVNDAYSVDHRNDASIVGIPAFLPSYAGILLTKEVDAIKKVLTNPSRPLISISGGNKISTKFSFLHQLLTLSDILLVGGGLANTLLLAKGVSIGKSIAELSFLEEAKQILEAGESKLFLPIDVSVGMSKNVESAQIVGIDEIPEDKMILDIGPKTQALFAEKIETAKTIIWNGPVGYFENKAFLGGTKAICEAITSNKDATSIIGGGDTIASIDDCPNTQNITHISTGGGAMLEFIEKGSLPGIDALSAKE